MKNTYITIICDIDDLELSDFKLSGMTEPVTIRKLSPILDLLQFNVESGEYDHLFSFDGAFTMGAMQFTIKLTNGNFTEILDVKYYDFI